MDTEILISYNFHISFHVKYDSVNFFQPLKNIKLAHSSRALQSRPGSVCPQASFCQPPDLYYQEGLFLSRERFNEDFPIKLCPQQ